MLSLILYHNYILRTLALDTLLHLRNILVLLVLNINIQKVSDTYF